MTFTLSLSEAVFYAYFQEGRDAVVVNGPGDIGKGDRCLCDKVSGRCPGCVGGDPHLLDGAEALRVEAQVLHLRKNVSWRTYRWTHGFRLGQVLST
jgi:hypothetical protein